MNISIVGTGYVGLVTGLCLADRGHRVTCVDIDEAKVAGLAAGVLPIYEPGLEDLLRDHLATSFFPTTDLVEAVLHSELTMITVGTPIENGAICLRYIEDATTAVGRALALKSDYHVVVVKSTVVPGTTEERVRPLLERESGKTCGAQLGLGMNPEFLREGEAVDDFQNPDRIVLGAVDRRSADTLARLYADFQNATHIHTTPRTAEMIKYASNALLATLISFSNEVGNLCSAADGVDVVEVLGAVHLDKRISPIVAPRERLIPSITAYLKAGCGFGGSCFPKDVRALIDWGQQRGRSTRLLSAVMETNERQAGEVIDLLRRHFPALKGVRVSVLGLAFKPGTDDIRESPALKVVSILADEGAEVCAYDPVATSPAERVLSDVRVKYGATLTEAIKESDAIVVLTAWPEFQQLPGLLGFLENPPVVIDGRRMFDKTHLPRYEGIGLSVPTTAVAGGQPVPEQLQTVHLPGGL